MNEVYLAAMEGRYPISIDMTKRGDVYVAGYHQDGIDIEVTDVDQYSANNRAVEEVLAALKDGKARFTYG